MSTPHRILSEITARSFLMRLVNPHLSRTASRRIAAKEIGEAERKQHQGKRKPKPAPVLRNKEGGIDYRALLAARIMGMLERMTAPAPAQPKQRRVVLRPQQPKQQEQPSLLSRVAAVLTPEPAPEQPVSPASPLVASSTGSSPVLIPDSEFSPRFQESPATQNWRKSIQDNVVNFNERRGTPKSSGRYVG